MNPVASTYGSSPLPRVSVVIPCHNYEQYLDEAISSALSQHGVDLDVIVIDDASTDASVRIARKWESHDARLSVVAFATNRGHIATFNEALMSASAPFVVKLDPDDILAPGSLRRAADILVANPSVSFVYGACVHFSGTPPEVRNSRRVSVTVWRGEKWIERRARGGVNVIAQPEVMIRVASLKKVGGHRPQVPEASDYNLWLRLASTGDVARIDAVQGLYRIHPNSMQRTIHSGVYSDLRARSHAWQLFLQERGTDLDGAVAVAVERRYRRTLAREALLRALDTFDQANAQTEPVDELVRLAGELDATATGSRRGRELHRRMAKGRGVATPPYSLAGFVRRHRWNHRVQWMYRYRT